MAEREVFPASTIALATPDQLQELIAFAALSPDAPHWPVSAWQSFLEPASRSSVVRRCLFTIRHEAEIAGVIAVAMQLEIAELELLLVKPALRRQGFGRALMAHWLQVAERNGVREAVLEVRASNRAAQELYQGLGFATEGVRPRYYSNPLEDALLLRREFAGKPHNAVVSTSGITPSGDT